VKLNGAGFARKARILFMLAIVLFAGTLSVALTAAKTPTIAEALTERPLEASGLWDYRLDAAGRLWLAYYDADRQLRLRRPDGQEQPLFDNAYERAPSGLALTPIGKNVGVMWRDKQPTKGLYLFDTNRSQTPPLEIGGDTEPLVRFLARPDDKDRLHVLWYGEKVGEPSGYPHHLYYRSIRLSTFEPSPIERLMPGIYPVMSNDAAGNLMVYSWVQNDTSSRIEAIYRPVDQSFGASVVIAEPPSITPIFKSFRSGSRWFVVWVGQYGDDRSEYLLEGAYSDDGKTWHSFAFEALRRLDIRSLQVVADEFGHILMAISGSYPAKAESELGAQKPKDDVLLIRSADRGESWSAPESLRAPEQGGNAELANFNARYPSVAFGAKPGEVLVVWEDWRNIRSGLYASLSNDYGQTWALSNIPLSSETNVNLGLHYEVEALTFVDGRFNLVAEHWTDDSLKTKQLQHITFSSEDLAQQAKSLKKNASSRQPASEAALRERVEGFWKALIAGDYKTTYTYQDPFFRASTPPQTYLSMMGKIKYAQAEIESIQIEGPRAKVETKIRASIPAFRAPKTGEMLSQPEREAMVNGTWLWIDGDWYLEFHLTSQNMLFTRY
jgi:hypothetical protein